MRSRFNATSARRLSKRTPCASTVRSARYVLLIAICLIRKDYDVCGDCYFAAEGRNVHAHPLTKVAEVDGTSWLRVPKLTV